MSKLRSLACCLAAVAGAGLMCSAPAGAACGNEALREAQHATFLPDCRAFEMVSPPEKGGSELTTGSAKMRAASDGSASTFRSLLPFADAIGTGVAVEYMAERSKVASPGDNGWATHAITPAQEPMNAQWVTMGYEPTYLVTSPDLSSGVLSARGLTGEPLVARVANLYGRSDLRAAGAGMYTLMSGCPLCEATSTPLPVLEKVGGGFSGLPYVAGVSGDTSRVLFESTLALLLRSNAKAAYPEGIRNVYESDHGATRLVSVVPASGVECVEPECLVPSGGAVAGMGEFFREYSVNRHVLSTDGTRAVFTANPTINSCPVGTNHECGELFLRELSGPGRTVKINASERATPETPRPATFWDASSDTSRVFFTSGEQLTETAGSGLYMFDLNAPAGHRLSLIGPTGEMVFGVSDDGHYVYFTAGTQLVAGQPALTDSSATGVYLWHDGPGTPEGGELRYIGELRYGHATEQTQWEHFEEARVTPDGRYLLFSSISGVGLLSHYGGYDYDQQDCSEHPGVRTFCNELYLYDTAANSLVCVSCRQDGVAAVKGASVRSDTQNDSASSQTGIHETRALSTDGHYAFFTTAESLVPQDTNGVEDAYEYDTRTGEVHLLSGAESADPSYFTDASADGGNAFFVTRGRLVGWDVDRAYDLYDARVNGGFPEPPALPPSCQGDACQPPPVTLIDQTPGTLTFDGPGNLTSPAKTTSAPAHRKPVKRKHNAKRKKGKRTRHAGHLARHRHGATRGGHR